VRTLTARLFFFPTASPLLSSTDESNILSVEHVILLYSDSAKLFLCNIYLSRRELFVHYCTNRHQSARSRLTSISGGCVPRGLVSIFVSEHLVHIVSHPEKIQKCLTREPLETSFSRASPKAEVSSDNGRHGGACYAAQAHAQSTSVSTTSESP
jgi:hypothetical protein